MGVTGRFDLAPVKAKLAACSESDLHVLMDAAYRAVDPPAFIGWLEYACRWELDRRRGRRNVGDLRCSVAFDDPALIDALLRFRKFVRMPQSSAFDLLDEIERLMQDPPARSESNSAA
jgi:hypothetical protein